jgi:hypothetical protein
MDRHGVANVVAVTGAFVAYSPPLLPLATLPDPIIVPALSPISSSPKIKCFVSTKRSGRHSRGGNPAEDGREQGRGVDRRGNGSDRQWEEYRDRRRDLGPDSQRRGGDGRGDGGRDPPRGGAKRPAPRSDRGGVRLAKRRGH